MSLELIFLGTGTSAGIPMIGCACPTCRSDDPRDQRFRPSVLIQYTQAIPHPTQAQTITRRVLIDTAPELRLQMLAHDISRLDAVVFTHAHADHIFGLDDLRRFNAVMDTPLNIYAEQSVLDRLRDAFWYIFQPHLRVNDSFVATLIPQSIAPDQPITFFGASWTPVRLMHGKLPILGFRVDLPCANPTDSSATDSCSVAYCTDVSHFPDETLAQLQNLDVLVIDALRHHPHPTHLTVKQALQVISLVKPKQAYLTHIAHEIRHADLCDQLPPNVFLAYDGCKVKCPLMSLPAGDC